VYMAMCPDRIPASHVAPWLLWLRLPVQGVLVIWVWYAAGPDRRAGGGVRT
jgi:uncharacterized membrane protein